MASSPPSSNVNWTLYGKELYTSRKGPLLGTVRLDELEHRVEEKFKNDKGAYMYVKGSAGLSKTYEANLAAFQKWHIIPRMLVDATERSVETTLFGRKLPSPVVLAPIGVQGILHADAELGSAKAAAKLGIPYTMSTASSRSIETISEAMGDSPRWYQLYWPRSEPITASILQRAKKAGFEVLVVTLDTMILGWRPHDLERAYLPFVHGVGAQVGLSDPVFMSSQGVETRHDIPDFPYEPAKGDKLYFDGDEDMNRTVKHSLAWMDQINSGVFKTWENIEILKKYWDGPIVLKGIQSVEDAHLALKAGVDGIIVSNHGGRQVDGAAASLFCLERIMASPLVRGAQGDGRFTVMFDSGIRTGSDIIKALALGAQGVLLGRPYVYGLALAGQEGVEGVIRSLLCDLQVTLGLAGFTSIQDIQGRGEKVLVKE